MNSLNIMTGFRMMLTSLLLAILAIGCNFGLAEDSGNQTQNDNMVENTFTESHDAFANPLKGFITSNALNPYTTLTRMDIRWRDIEATKADGLEKLKKYSDFKFSQFDRIGIKVITRIIGCWPQNSYAPGRVKSAYGRWCDVYWPNDLDMRNMSIADYASEEFKSRAVSLIDKLGKAWDNDRRVAYIHMGIVGYWGEQNSPFVSDVPGLEKVMGDACVAAFKHKCVARRLHSTFKDYNFGIYYDSFGHADTDDWKYMIEMGDYWKTQAITGEVAYDWGNYQIQPGSSPTVSLSEPKHFDFLVGLVRKTHTSALSWISEYDLNDKKATDGAREFQKALGYRFVIPWARFSPMISKEQMSLETRFAIVNVGSAPLYADYALRVHLLSLDDHSVVWTGDVDADCMNWMPGDAWSDEKNCYTEVPSENIVSGTWSIPVELSGKEYYLAVTLDDKEKNTPAVRFANDNYFTGGYTVIGRIGVGITPTTNSVSGTNFDKLFPERLK